MKTNRASKHEAIRTHEGAEAARIDATKQLRRSVLSCMLWENEHYEDGLAIADRIRDTVKLVPASAVAQLAIDARTQYNLRHVPLYLTAVLAGVARGSSLVSDTLEQVIQRADELAEFLAIYAKVNGVTSDKLKPKLSNQVRKGLARAFCKFNDYALAKYNRDNAIKLADVLFLCHAKPKNAEQKANWEGIMPHGPGQKYSTDQIKRPIAIPDTWETELSAGKDKRETFERLLCEGKLGYLALLRNLRNMEQAGVDVALVRDAILARKGGAERVLPFRYVAAAKAAPRFEADLDQAMLAGLAQVPKLSGKTVGVIDVSGSMYHSNVSAKSDMLRVDSACALAAILREICADPVIYATAGSDAKRKHATKLVPNRRGMALVEAINAMCQPLGGGGIFLKQVMDYIAEHEQDVERVIVITDEQDCGVGNSDSPLRAKIIGRHNYLINVASARNGIGYGKWTHVDGFSEQVLRWIAEYEAEGVFAQTSS